MYHAMCAVAVRWRVATASQRSGHGGATDPGSNADHGVGAFVLRLSGRFLNGGDVMSERDPSCLLCVCVCFRFWGGFSIGTYLGVGYSICGLRAFAISHVFIGQFWGGSGAMAGPGIRILSRMVSASECGPLSTVLDSTSSAATQPTELRRTKRKSAVSIHDTAAHTVISLTDLRSITVARTRSTVHARRASAPLGVLRGTPRRRDDHTLSTNRRWARWRRG